MERFTLSLDEELATAFDELIKERGYIPNSPTIVIDAGISARRIRLVRRATSGEAHQQKDCWRETYGARTRNLCRPRWRVKDTFTCSMSRSGDCWDNAAMESFVSTLKMERTHRTNYRTRDEAKVDVFDYIERFYNPRRRHSTLGYLIPAQYEKSASSG